MSTHLPIGVFDSGVGGLSVVKEISKILPLERLEYVADSAYAPYGEKSAEQIIERASHITEFLLGWGAKAIVVACNTATAVAVSHLRANYDVPIIAMEPAVKPAAALTKTDVIGVLATAGTLNSSRYAELVDRHGHHVQVEQRICREWVKQVESGDLDSETTRAIIAADVQPLLDKGADVLVLGCTHYPFLKPMIEQVAGKDVQLIDPSPAVADQLRRRLAEHRLLAESKADNEADRYWASGDPGQLKTAVKELLGKDISVSKME